MSLCALFHTVMVGDLWRRGLSVFVEREGSLGSMFYSTKA
jgi:hypothetical protein